uniref:Obscurin-like protein 1 n=1 Tax=Petromyzon marinus TaxID=7757 RepID=A0AAJ7U7G7_PETMA|nr:obscurin-like protein 1 [Petromyzon marinus]
MEVPGGGRPPAAPAFALAPSSGPPPPRVSWEGSGARRLRSDGRLEVARRLPARELEAGEAGRYACRTRNFVGEPSAEFDLTVTTVTVAAVTVTTVGDCDVATVTAATVTVTTVGRFSSDPPLPHPPKVLTKNSDSRFPRGDGETRKRPETSPGGVGSSSGGGGGDSDHSGPGSPLGRPTSSECRALTRPLDAVAVGVRDRRIASDVADGDRSAEGIEPATSDPDLRWGQQQQLQRRQSDSGLPSAPDDAQSLVHRKRHGSSGGGVYDSGVYHSGVYNSGVYNSGVYHSGVYHSGVYNSGVDSHSSNGDDGGGSCRPSALMTTTTTAATQQQQQHRYQSHSETPGVFTVTEGKHARLSCRVTGKPKPDIVWMKSGVPLRRSRRYMMYEDEDGGGGQGGGGGGGGSGGGGGGLFVLRVLFCRQEDNGFYTCSASNAIGQTFSAVQLVVNEPQLLFKSRLRDVEVPERGVATLECEVPSAGLSARWFLEDTPLAPDHKYGIEADGTKRRLVIRDVTADDDAVYVCETRGGSRTVAELSVRGRIVQKLPRLVEVRQGEALTLAVEVDDALLEGEWLRDGVAVAAAAAAALTTAASGRTRTLEIARVALGDDCDVTFKAGESRTTCKVRVKVPAPRWPPSDFRVRTVSYSTVSLEWRAPPTDGGVDAARYAVEMRARGDRAPAWVDVSGPGARTELTVGGLQTGAEFEFRVAAVGAQGGRGPFAELRGPVLVKGDVEVLSPLSDVHASRDDDAAFTIQLSRPMPGQWLRDGVQISSAGAAAGTAGTAAGTAAAAIDDGRHIVGHLGATHTLVVRRVGWRDDGAAIVFLAGALRADAALYVTEGAGLFSRLLSVSFAFAIVAYLLSYLLAYLLGGGGGSGGPGGGLLEGTPMDRLT